RPAQGRGQGDSSQEGSLTVDADAEPSETAHQEWEPKKRRARGDGAQPSATHPEKVGSDAGDREAVREVGRLGPFMDQAGEDRHVEHRRGEYGRGQPEPGPREPGQGQAVGARFNVPLAEQEPTQRAPRTGGLQHLGLHGFAIRVSGNFTTKVVPSPSLLETSMRPPCASTRYFAW